MRSISDVPAEEVITTCNGWRVPAVFGDSESVIRSIGELTAHPSHENHNILVLLIEDLGLSVPDLCFDRYTRVLTMKVNVIMSRQPTLVTLTTSVTLGTLLNAASEIERKEISQFNSRVSQLIDGYVDNNYDNLMIPVTSLKGRIEQLTRENETLRRDNTNLREDLSQMQAANEAIKERLAVIEALLTMMTTGQLPNDFSQGGFLRL